MRSAAMSQKQFILSQAVIPGNFGVPPKPLGAAKHSVACDAELRSSALLQGLNSEDCSYIVGQARVIHVGKNVNLFLQGDPLKQVVMLLKGHIKLTRLQPDGSELILAIRSAMDTLDLSVLSLRRHRVAAQSMTECSFLTWSLPTLEKLMQTFPQTSRNIHGILLREIAELQTRYCELSLEKVDIRLACTIVRLSKRIGIRSDQGIEVHVSRQELAQMSNTSIFTVSRLVSRWGELGLLQPKREMILVTRLAAFIEMARVGPGHSSGASDRSVAASSLLTEDRKDEPVGSGTHR